MWVFRSLAICAFRDATHGECFQGSYPCGVLSGQLPVEVLSGQLPTKVLSGQLPITPQANTSYGGPMCPPEIIACATMRALARRRWSALVAAPAVCRPGAAAAAAAAKGGWWFWKVMCLRPDEAGTAVVARRAGEGVWSVAFLFVGVARTAPVVSRGEGLAAAAVVVAACRGG